MITFLNESSSLSSSDFVHDELIQSKRLQCGTVPESLHRNRNTATRENDQNKGSTRSIASYSVSAMNIHNLLEEELTQSKIIQSGHVPDYLRRDAFAGTRQDNHTERHSTRSVISSMSHSFSSRDNLLRDSGQAVFSPHEKVSKPDGLGNNPLPSFHSDFILPKVVQDRNFPDPLAEPGFITRNEVLEAIRKGDNSVADANRYQPSTFISTAEESKALFF